MPSAKSDFGEFIDWIHSAEGMAPSKVRKFANLILANFDAVGRTTRTRSQRSALLSSLAREQWAQISDERPNTNLAVASGSWPWKRLQELKVGPFRGFRLSEQFELQKRILLFFGPNGTGKTSFCEALEYALIGSVSEAEAKRIPENSYLANIHERKFVPPTLTATAFDGTCVEVKADPDLFRFCFVEKNRIDSFSRIAARTPAQRADLIATLFGLDKFSDFVGDFNDSMDNQLVTVGTQGALLMAKRESVAQDQILVAARESTLAGFDAIELALAQSYSPDLSFNQLKLLIGSEMEPGRLHELNGILNAVPPSLIGITKDKLQRALSSTKVKFAELQRLKEALLAKSEQVSFKDLYTAIISLNNTVKDRCPACDTPLSGKSTVTRNPFEKASEGLNELSELSSLQSAQRTVADQLNVEQSALKSSLDIIRFFLETSSDTNISLLQYLRNLPNQLEGCWWHELDQEKSHSQASEPFSSKLMTVVSQIEVQDSATRVLLDQRETFIRERDLLLELQLKVQQSESNRARFIQDVSDAELRIAKFDLDNAELIEAVAKEEKDLERDTPIKIAYDEFLSHLKSYFAALPAQFIAGLNDLTMQLYNDFNRDDLDSDKLATLELPVSGDKKIQISFRGNADYKLDALQVLSEGHIRCLGLAILLAKNLQLKNPLIIFDDAINAIDHEHRRGIRETIFASDQFVNSQIIVTCHSNEFIKDIHQSLPQDSQGDQQLCVFRPHTGNYHPRISGGIATRNYVAIARAERDSLNDRAALDACRKALEYQTERVWRWLGKNDHGQISLPLTHMGAEPNLRNLCEALRKKLDSLSNFSHCDKLLAQAALVRILGVPPQNLVWTYLNKGTHQESDRDDFDGSEVEKIVETLEELNSLRFR